MNSKFSRFPIFAVSLSRPFIGGARSANALIHRSPLRLHVYRSLSFPAIHLVSSAAHWSHRVDQIIKLPYGDYRCRMHIAVGTFFLRSCQRQFVCAIMANCRRRCKFSILWWNFLCSFEWSKMCRVPARAHPIHPTFTLHIIEFWPQKCCAHT